ncbi:HHR234Cp [Eremothecium sinecaudum]|uniref:Kinetochore protein NDC80 n=1 Tax=Eremothecium sinecaudum TaxID=45286 RepID=A0A0X8HX40_9SACH|nr:HHR234Cp [Eremothecium sinecaudum]AMD23003.1 HHR234Cp [Eremothecium sinecaudum]
MADRRRSSGAHGVLNQLNPQNFTSQIPLLTNNASKKGLSNDGSALTDMINQSLARNSRSSIARGNEVRKSLRRSIRASQRMSIVPGNGAGGNGASINGSQVRDPRPLRDKNYQSVLQQEIFEYLQFQRFDIDTGHPISLKSLKQPTQKDFIYIFRWLYQRIDPGYAFKKSLENEVYSILRTIHYPYLETINKSQISAVGGSNWHKFLGMLHWLVNINKRLDTCLQKLDESKTSQITQDVTILNLPVTTLDEQDEKHEQYELMVERLFIEYISKCYRSFINMEDNFTPFRQELEIGFDRFVHIIQADIDKMIQQEEMLKYEFETMESRSEGVKLEQQKQKALQSDLHKFQTYINAMKPKASDWPLKLEQMEAEIKQKKNLIKEAQLEIEKLRGVMNQSDLEHIDTLNRKRDAYSQKLDTVTSRLDQLTGSVKSQKLSVESSYKVFLDTLDKYEAAINGVILARNSLGHKINANALTISISPDFSISDNIEATPESIILNRSSIAASIKPVLLSLNKEIQSRIESLQWENSKLESELLALQDNITSKNQLLESMENELSNVKSEYEEYQQVSHSKLLSQRIEIEKLERKIQNDRNKTQQRKSQAEQEIEDAKFQLKELKLNLQQEKILMHKKVIQLIQYVVNFKMDAQNSIEELHDLTQTHVKTLQ